MTLPMPPAKDETRSQEAADWVLRLQSPELSEATTSDWLAWCEADPRNRQSFEAMAQLWAVTGELDTSEFASGRRDPANDEDRFRFTRWRAAGWAAAAAIVLALVGALWLVQPGAVERPAAQSQVARLETPRGQVQATTLEDGSRIELGGRTSLSVRYSAERRLVLAEEGEAFFQVARNPERPFIVEAGPVTITAVGTAFSVQRDGDAVTVAVTEGIVEVRALSRVSPGGGNAAPTLMRVVAGHRVRFDRGELTRSVEPARGDIVAPWREGRLEFRDEPLRLVVARINRYSARQLEISDPSIADLRVTTTVYDDRVDAWLEGLSAVLPVRVNSIASNRAVISPAT